MNNTNLKVNLGGIQMQNPVTVCSGTFAYGKEYSEYFEINNLGAITTKGVSRDPWAGNDSPRLAEVTAGILNSIGLQNPGVQAFKNDALPWLAQNVRVPVIVNVAGHAIDEYTAVIEELDEEEKIAAYEVNISCPNVDKGGMAFGTDPLQASAVTQACRALTNKPLIIKLTPNVTDIASIAAAVEDAGADAVSLINTVNAMAIDARTRKPKLARVTGGLSGPAIKPIALRAVWQVYNAVHIPILGMGGISNGIDAIEFMLAGATAVAVGTSNFVKPDTCIDVIDGMLEYCNEQGVHDIQELIGALEV